MLGKLEEIVLFGSKKFARGGMASEIFMEIDTSFERSFSFGAIHTTLGRLTTKGFLRIEKCDVNQESTRARKKYFITAEGQRALEDSLTLSQSMIEGSMSGEVCYDG